MVRSGGWGKDGFEGETLEEGCKRERRVDGNKRDREERG